MKKTKKVYEISVDWGSWQDGYDFEEYRTLVEAKQALRDADHPDALGLQLSRNYYELGEDGEWNIIMFDLIEYKDLSERARAARALGKASAAKRSPDYYSELSKKRWQKRK